MPRPPHRTNAPGRPPAKRTLRVYYPRPGGSGPGTLAPAVVGTVGRVGRACYRCVGAAAVMHPWGWECRLRLRLVRRPAGPVADWGPVLATGYADRRDAAGRTFGLATRPAFAADFFTR